MDHVDDFNSTIFTSAILIFFFRPIALNFTATKLLHFYIATTTPEILFARHGRIKKIKLYTSSDGKKKGDALVTYVRPESVSKACLQVHCVTIRLHYCIMFIAELCCCIVLCIILLYYYITFLLYYYTTILVSCGVMVLCTILYCTYVVVP